MENILDVLKAMKKASAREIAARMNIDPRDALDMLREHEARFEVAQVNGYWWLTTTSGSPAYSAAGSAPDASARTSPKQTPKRVREKTTSPLVGEILAAMEGEGAMSTNQIAQKTGRSARALNASLGAMSKNGQVTRHVDRKNITWSISGQDPAAPADSVPETAAAPVQPAPPASPAPVHIAQELAAKTTAEIVQDIPAFTARADDLIVPSARFISSEIRRTKTKLAKLQKLQGVMRELRRHKGMLQSLTGEVS